MCFLDKFNEEQKRSNKKKLLIIINMREFIRRQYTCMYIHKLSNRYVRAACMCINEFIDITEFTMKMQSN